MPVRAITAEAIMSAEASTVGPHGNLQFLGVQQGCVRQTPGPHGGAAARGGATYDSNASPRSISAYLSLIRAVVFPNFSPGHGGAILYCLKRKKLCKRTWIRRSYSPPRPWPCYCRSFRPPSPHTVLPRNRPEQGVG